VKLKNRVHYFRDFWTTQNSTLVRELLRLANRLSKPLPDLHNAVGRRLFYRNSRRFNVDSYLKYFGWNVYALPPIADRIKQDKFDILHAGFGNRPATAAMILSDLTRIPFSFETHAYDLFVDFPFAAEKIERASKIFTISNYNRQYLTEQLACPLSKITVIRVPFNKRYCDTIADKIKKNNLVVSACRLHPIKGLEHAIEAFHLLFKEGVSVRFLIIGDGPLNSQLRSRVEELSLSDRITFLGDISNEQTLEYIAEATVFLLPSVIAANGDRDGIPTSLIEAMYLKTPVISSRVSGIPELVDHGVNGFLTAPGKVEEISQRLKDLLSDESLRIQMGERAREKVKREFNISDNSDKLVKAWEEIR